MLLVDNCILQSLGSARYLHLLKTLKDLRTTTNVAREQERTAPLHSQQAFKKAVQEGWLRVENPPSGALTDPVYERTRPLLGATDAGLLAWAKTAKAILLTDDTNLLTLADKESVQWLDLVDVLDDLVKAGVLKNEELQKVVNAIEFENGRKFKPADLERLGLR